MYLGHRDFLRFDQKMRSENLSDRCLIGRRIVECCDRLWVSPECQNKTYGLVVADYASKEAILLSKPEEDIWRFMTFGHLASRDELEAWIGSGMDARREETRGAEVSIV